MQVHDVSVENETPYMVLELLAGQTLAELLQKKVILTEEAAADLLVPIVAGVATAHDCGIVHRDLKPQNLFISEEHAHFVPRVLDFGISKLVDDEAPVHTRSDVILGTAHYMSPEQVRGSKTLDARSDQYALGAVLYECVTGRKAFDDDALLVLVNRIGAGEFERPSRVYSGVSRDMESVILKAMALLPDDRYPTTAALGQALLRFSSYQTRLNYAREFARTSHVATTSALELPRASGAPSPLAHVPFDVAPAAGSKNTDTLVPAHSVSKRETPRPRQLAVALLLLCLGMGVGYSLNVSTHHGDAAQPSEGMVASADAEEFGTQHVDVATSSTALPANVASPVVPAPPVSSSNGTRGLTSSPNSVSGRGSSVASTNTFVQKGQPALSHQPLAASSSPFSTPLSSLPTSQQNRAQQYGLVQETPF